MAKEITEATVTQITRSVQQTYPVQLKDVQKEVDNIIEGHKPTNIIGMLVHGMLEKNGYLVDVELNLGEGEEDDEDEYEYEEDE